MPAIIARSISILSDAGLGMAMFSLGVWISDISLLYVSVILFLYGCIMYGLIAADITVYSFRLVHGIAAANHCLREQTRCIRDGYSVPHGSSGHGCCLHSCRAARSSSAHSHCSGILQSCVTNWHTAHNWEKGSRILNCHSILFQAALPQGIVPFVFAKEYNVHPDILSTA